jgi:hypothetical protein
LQYVARLLNQLAHQLLKIVNPSAAFCCSVNKQGAEDSSDSTRSHVVALSAVCMLLIMPQEPQQVPQQTLVGVRQGQKYLAHSLTPLSNVVMQL